MSNKMDLLLFLAGAYLSTFIVGRLLEKIRIPWIFSALLIGFGLSIYNPFTEITSSSTFIFLANLGIYFLLFIIGFELDIKNIIKQKSFVFKTTAAVILAETFLGTIFVHYIFGISWWISILVASSFATVGEAVLLPILDEFKLVKTKLGQTILGIGVLDDLIEIITIIIVSVLIGRNVGHTHFSIWTNLLILGLLFGLVFILVKLHKHLDKFKFSDIPELFLFVIFFLFLFTGIGNFVESAALGALLAGIAIRNIVSKSNLKFVESEIRTTAYGLFAPLFFLGVGMNTKFGFLTKSFHLVLIIVAITAIAKIGTTVLMGKKKFGLKKSAIMGVGLTVKLSTSIVIIQLLFQNNLIKSELYSILIAATIIFTIFVPLLLPNLLKYWNLGLSKQNEKNKNL